MLWARAGATHIASITTTVNAPRIKVVRIFNASGKKRI
jgi:hypothetical protein